MKNLTPLFLIIAVVVILIIGYILVLEPAQAKAAYAKPGYTVNNLSVGDVEYDDGTGLRISWTPLGKDKRIIEYRVYRGISTDSLFYIGNIPVNPKTGVASDTMYYYDKGYTPFMDINSPGKLKKERHVPADSPLYQEMPRDLAVTGPYLNHYIILGVIPKDQFYYKTTPVTRSEKNPETGKMEDQTYAGVKIRQVKLMKELVPDHPYFYTVVAVDKAGHHYPCAQPVMGVPRDNSPEKPKDFYPVFVEDAPRLQFEYTIPTENGDVMKYSVFAVDEANLPAFQAYTEFLKASERQNLADKDYVTKTRIDLKKMKPEVSDSTRIAIQKWIDSASRLSAAQVAPSLAQLVSSVSDSTKLKDAFAKAGFPAPFATVPLMPVENPMRLVAERSHALPYTTMNFMIVPLKGDSTHYQAIDPVAAADVKIDTTFAVSRAELAHTCFIIGFYDGAGMVTYSEPTKLVTKAPGQYYTRNDLPKLMPFNVSDMINDKGDCNTLSWGAPTIFLTKAAFLNDTNTKLRINYQVEKNKNFRVSSIYFDIYDASGKQITRINEYYQNNMIELSSKTDLTKGLRVEITMQGKQVRGPKLDVDFANYKIIQELKFSDVTRALEPQAPMIDGEDANKFSTVFFREPLDATKFRFVRKLGGTSREMNDASPYELSIFKQINQFDAKKQLMLVSGDLSITYNPKLKGNTRTFVYKSDEDKFISDLKKEIDKYQKMADSLGADNPAAAMPLARVKAYTTQYDLMTKDSLLVASRQFKNDHARIKFIANQREIDKRSWRYLMMRTNGNGLFDVSDVYKENGRDAFFPIPNWYDSSKTAMLIASIVFGLLVIFIIGRARRGANLYIRPISGLQEIDNAVGRATEMGRPILYVPGLSGITDVATLAALGILNKVAKKAAEYDTRILVPCRDLIVLPIAQEIVREAHYEAGRPDSYDPKSVFYITGQQFAFVAGVNGVMIREKTATNFYMGMFYAESLIMTETGSSTGAIQIAGTDAVTQIPFFITTCDYTLIGEELYAASAYMSHEPLMLGTLKAQDYYKFLILLFIIAGTILSTAHATFLINVFPDK
jgi:hypothetical protein